MFFDYILINPTIKKRLSMNILNSQSNLPSPALYSIYRCTQSYYHPTIDKKLLESNLYQVTAIDTVNNTVKLTDEKSEEYTVCTEFFQTHFEEVYTAENAYARRLYINGVTDVLLNKVKTVFGDVKCNCAEEIIDSFATCLKDLYV